MEPKQDWGLEYRRILIDMYMSELVSHGAMGISLSIALVSFLPFAVNYLRSDLNDRLFPLHFGLFWILLAFLLGLTSYIAARSIWYGYLLDAVGQIKPKPGDMVDKFFGNLIDPKERKDCWIESDDVFWNYSQLVIMRANCRCGEPLFEGGKLVACKAFESTEHPPEPKEHFWRQLLIQPRHVRDRIIVHLFIGLVASSALLWVLAG